MDGVVQVPGCSEEGSRMFYCGSSDVLMLVHGWYDADPWVVQCMFQNAQIVETERLSRKVRALWGKMCGQYSSLSEVTISLTFILSGFAR